MGSFSLCKAVSSGREEETAFLSVPPTIQDRVWRGSERGVRGREDLPKMCIRFKKRKKADVVIDDLQTGVVLVSEDGAHCFGGSQ